MFRMKTLMLDLAPKGPQVYPPLKEGEVPLLSMGEPESYVSSSHSGRIEGHV